MQNKKIPTAQLVSMGIFLALIILCTLFIRIPIGSGYVHLGFAMAALAMPILGLKCGVLVASVGQAAADLISGFAIWAPGTFLVSVIGMGIYGFSLDRTIKKYEKIPLAPRTMEFCGTILAGIITVFGYYIYGALVLYGWAGALVEVLPDAAQFLIGIIVARTIGIGLCKTPIIKVFAYPYETKLKEEK